MAADAAAAPASEQVISWPPQEPHEHPFARVLQSVDPSYYNYDAFECQWYSPEPYELHKKIGRGKYSEVFTATNRLNGARCVVKVLRPVKERKFKRELLILQNLSGVPNVIALYDMVRDPSTQTPALVFEPVTSIDYRMLYPTFSEMDVKFYLFELLRTLDICHSMGIMHRDVKPQNICIDHEQRYLRLIDWGLAEFYHHQTPVNVRVASRYYKGPELLVGDRCYDYRLDIWSLGCMFGAMLLGRETLFVGKDNDDQLLQIIKVLGSQALVEYCGRVGLEVPAGVPSCPKRPWVSLLKAPRALATPIAFDLLDRMLQIDFWRRPTAAEAMRHPYFDAVRPSATTPPVHGSPSSAPGSPVGGAAAASAAPVAS